jgi:hypothetical protein
MEIQAISAAPAQQRSEETAAIQVQRLAQDAMREQSAVMDKLLASVEYLTDPNLGNNVDLLA